MPDSGEEGSVESLLKQAAEALFRRSLDKAEALCREALSIEPRNVEGTLLLARIAQAESRPELALQLIRRATALSPESFESQSKLGVLLSHAGVYAEAASVWQKVIAIDPSDAASYANLGSCLVALGKVPEAAAQFQQAVLLAPTSPDFHSGLATCLFRLSRPSGALNELEQAVSLDREFMEGYLAMAAIWKSLGQTDRQLETLLRARRQRIPGGQNQLQLGHSLLELGSFADAEECLRSAIEQGPPLARAHGLLGALLLQTGRFEEAASELKTAIALDPNEPAPYQLYTRSKKIDERDRPILEQMERFAFPRSTSAADQEWVEFGLGKAYEDLGEYDKAMEHFDKGNAAALSLQPSDRRFSAKRYEDLIQEATSRCTNSTFARHAEVGLASELPVFIVGMMRSGTTLVEQVISCHPEVGAGGELPFWSEKYTLAEDLIDKDSPELGELAQTYLHLLEQLVPGKKRVTDKMPQNFWWLGVIHAAFPRARIIHCRRNPLDTCISIYTTHMREFPDFAHSLQNIAFVYEKYLEIMGLWRRVLPPEIFLEIDYEDLVADQEVVTRTMIEFCGLEWDEACLRPEANLRTISTPSLWQARQPIYGDSVGKWRRYERWLDALKGLT